MKEDIYSLDTVRHSLAHIMAAAIQKLFPNVKFAGGPAIENGFYYDFESDHKFTPDDFSNIENMMKTLIKEDYSFDKKIVSLQEAKEIFKDQPYKMEWLEEYNEEGKDLSIYKVGDFIDLCKGPHVKNSGCLEKTGFKIRNVAGAYWKGDSNNIMLQRIYVDAFLTKEELDNFLKMQEEASLRDHRKIAKIMDLFHFEPDYAPGAVFWHDKGFRIYRRLIEYIRKRQEKAGYIEISTPTVMDRSLWEISGHWAKYGEHNYSGKTQDGKTFCIKPMSCPGCMLVFKQGIKSYKDLPLYLSEFGKVNRFEATGGLSGLMRVREFTQDDAHIFCTEEQLEPEIVKILEFIKDIYSKFGFNEVSMKLATRKNSEFRIGSDEIWDKTEGALKNALIKNNIKFQEEKEDAAFYGPKIDIYLKDSMGRKWQCGTIQLDMNLPERFDLSYIGEDGKQHRPIMLHRAMLGSIERFLGILIESTAGKLPLWLSPEPVVITPVSEKFNDYAKEISNKLFDNNIRSGLDLRSEKLSYKIRELTVSKTPIILIVGEKELENGTVTMRIIDNSEQKTIKLDDFLSYIVSETKLPN